MSEISATLCATLSINAMGFMTSYHLEITRQYSSEGVNKQTCVNEMTFSYKEYRPLVGQEWLSALGEHETRIPQYYRKLH